MGVNGSQRTGLTDRREDIGALLGGFTEGFQTKFLRLDIQLAGRSCVAAPTLMIFCMALAVNLIGALGGAFVYYPDSVTYVRSAYVLLSERSFGGLTWPGGLFRVPGYTVFLASILGLFGKHAMFALALAQHGLAAIISMFVVKIGNELDRTRWLGLSAGMLSAFSLQLQGYARIPMSEMLYAFFLIWGFWLTLRYLRTGGSRPFIGAALLFSIATLVRPVGQYLVVLLVAVPAAQLLFPRCKFLFPSEGVARDRPANARLIVVACAIYAAAVGPWVVRNLKVHDYFGLIPTLGINLYSNAIEFGRLMPNDSAALNDIKARWGEWEAKRLASGERPETRYDWRHHMRSLGYYMLATGTSQQEADKVFLRAALDAIGGHPLGFARHVLASIYQSFAWNALAYAHLPGIEADKPAPSYAPAISRAQPVTIHAESKDKVRAAAAAFVSDKDNPFQWRAPTAFTPFYGAMVRAYYVIHSHGYRLFQVYLVGLALVVYLTVRDRDIRWLAVLVFLGYTTVLPFLIVPGAARHRLPADPVIDVIFGLLMIFGVAAALRAWTILTRPRGGANE